MKERYNPKERIGVEKFALLIAEHSNWIFQSEPTVDIGVDAIIEQAINGDPNGALIACQIKSGNGNFFTTKDKRLVYYVSHVHREYWTNYDLPIILILVDDDGIIYWGLLNHSTIKKAKKNFKIEIPKSQRLLPENINDVLEQVLHSKNPRELVVGSDVDDLDIIIEDATDITDLIDSLQNISNYCDNYSNNTQSIALKMETDKNINAQRLNRLMSKYSSQKNLLARRIESEIEVFVKESSKILISMGKLINYLETDSLTSEQFQIIFNSIDSLYKGVVGTQTEFSSIIDVFKKNNYLQFRQVKKASSYLSAVFALFEQEMNDVILLVESVKEALETIKPKELDN